MSIEGKLNERLIQLSTKRFKTYEMCKIMCDFLISPHLPDIIELNNTLHEVKLYSDGHNTSIEITHERKKKSGLFNWLQKCLCPWAIGIKIRYNKDGALFFCEYYSVRFFSLADKLKSAYYEKLYQSFNVGFVVVDKTR